MKLRWNFAFWVLVLVLLVACAQVPGTGTGAIPSTQPVPPTGKTSVPGARPTPPSPVPDQPVALTWQRSGGIAGQCQRLTVFTDGSYRLEDCIKNAVLREGRLPDSAQAQIKDWSNRYASFQWKSTRTPGSADMFEDQLSFTGKGSQVVPSLAQKEVVTYLAGLTTQLRATPVK